MSSRRFRTLAAACLLAAMVIAFFWKLVLTRQYDWVWGPDLAEQVLPWLDFQAREFQSGRFPFWDPSFWCGQPMLGQAQPGTAFPLNWLLFALPLDATGHLARASLQWYFVAIHILAALFAFALVRDLKRSRMAAIAAGLFFSLGGYIGHTDWPQMLNGALWAPLIFLFVLRIANGDPRPYSSAIWAGVFQGVAWLSGHHEAPMYTSLAALAVIAWESIRQRSRPIAFSALIFGAFALGTGAMQILPGYEYGRLAMRFGAPGGFQWNQYVPYSVHAKYSLTALGLPGIIFPTLQSDLVAFAGIIAFSIGLAGAVFYWRRVAVRSSVAVALCGLLYSLGGQNVLQGLMYATIPQLNRARHPLSAILIFDLGLAVLFAFGFDALRSVSLRARLSRILLAFGLLGTAVMTTLTVMGLVPGDPIVAMTPYFALLLAALFWMQSKGLPPSIASAALLLLLFVELGGPAQYLIVENGETNRVQFLERMRSNQDIAAFLRHQPGPFRILTDSKDLPDNWAGLQGLETTIGYLGGISNNILRLDRDDAQIRRLLGLRFRIQRDAPAGAASPVFVGASGLRVFEDDAAFPRAWIVYRTAQIVTEKAPLLGIDATLLRSTAYVENSHLQATACDSEPSLTYESAWRIRTQTACPGILIVSRTWFPGWQASIDGKASRVEQVDGALQGVSVPAGSHLVVFTFRPQSFLVGAAITLLSILLALALARRFRHQEVRMPHNLHRLL